MKSSTLMRCSVLFGLSLLRPSAVPAQSINGSDIFGTWAGVRGEDSTLRNTGDSLDVVEHTLVLRPDSIFEETRVRKNGTKLEWKGYWRVAGDSLYQGAETPRKITLQNQKLSLSFPPGWWWMGAVYQRVDTSKRP